MSEVLLRPAEAAVCLVCGQLARDGQAACQECKGKLEEQFPAPVPTTGTRRV